MRKVLASFILVFLLISLLNNPAYTNGENSADGENGEYDPFDKLARGAINLLVSPLELFQGIADAFSEHDIAVAWPMSIFWGPVNMAKRAAVGIFEIVTFPFPQPSNYGPLIEEPAFLREKAEKLKKEQEAKAKQTKVEEIKAEEIKTEETETEETEIEEEPDSDLESPFPSWDDYTRDSYLFFHQAVGLAGYHKLFVGRHNKHFDF